MIVPVAPGWPREHGGFLVGANLPWIDYGWDFGRNAWSPEGGLARAATRRVAAGTLQQLGDAGIECVRWFVLCDGRAGVRFDDRGWPAGVDECLFGDLDAAVALLDQAHLSAILVLVDFLWFARVRWHSGVGMGGHADVVENRDARRRLLDLVVRPVMARYGRHPSIFAWDAVNEPEWAIRRHPVRTGAGVPRRLMRDFIRDVASLVHTETAQLVTVGSASVRTLSLVKGLGLDFYQPHWYDHLDRQTDPARSAAALGLDIPLVLGEFPTAGSAFAPGEILDRAERAGYRGALAWSVTGTDRWSDAGRLHEELRDWIGRRALNHPPGPESM